MDPRLQRRVQRYGWDRAAAHYDHHWSRQLLPAQRLLLEMAELAPGERVLDVACGTGQVTFAAEESVAPDGTVVAADISEEMVRRVEEEAASRGLDGTVETTRCGAEDLRAEGESFDVVLCSLGLMYVPDPAAALQEAFRVLRPGGRHVAAVWGARSACGWAEIFPIVDARVETEVCPLFFQLGTADSLEHAFRTAGFEGVTARRITTELRYPSADEAVGAVFAAGPVAMAYSRFDDDVRSEVHREYLDSIEEYEEGEGYRIPGEFVVVRGIRPGDPDGERVP